MLNESIIKIRCALQKKNLKKSGKNKFAGFDYFELADFLPTLNELMLAEGVNDLFSIDENYATLRIVKGEEMNIYRIPFVQFPTPLNKQGQPSMQDIQYLGALNTYYKRYLYLNAFGITDGDVIEAMDQVQQPEPKPASAPAPAKKKPAKKIGQEGINTILSYCREFGINSDALCQLYKVDCIENITETMYANMCDHWDDIYQKLGGNQ